MTTSAFLAFFFIGKIRGAWPEAQAFSPEGYLLSIPGPTPPSFAGNRWTWLAKAAPRGGLAL